MRSVKGMFCAAAGLLMAVTSASGADAIRISGPTTVNAAVFAEHKAAIEAAVGQPILVSPNGSGTGLKDFVEGRADVAMLSSVLAKVAEKANIDPKGLNQFPLGGPDLAIVPVVEALGGGVRMLTEEGVMHGAAIHMNAKAVKGDKIAGLVKITPGALGVASSQHNTTGTVGLKTDKAVPQMLVLVVKGAASPAIQKLVAAARTAAKP